MVSLLGFLVFIMGCYMLLKEAQWRKETYNSENFTACLEFSDGRRVRLQGAELLLGKSKAADIQIKYPQLYGKRLPEIKGLDEIHSYLKIQNDGNWYIKNLSEKFPIVLKNAEESKVLLPGVEEWVKLFPEEEIVFGTYALQFIRGGSCYEK